MKSLDTFDFMALPALNKPMVLELARCEFVVARENIIALGNSGTGKTHIALALGLAVRIPGKMGSCSTRSWALIPRHRGQPFHASGSLSDIFTESGLFGWVKRFGH